MSSVMGGPNTSPDHSIGCSVPGLVLLFAFLLGLLMLLAVLLIFYSLTLGYYYPLRCCLLVCWNGLRILASLCWFCVALEALVSSGLEEAAAFGWALSYACC
ncbi:hypothetical protein Peur_004635 [Populus x canadensis]